MLTALAAAAAWASPSAAWSATSQDPRASAAASGTQLWTARYNGPGNTLSTDDLACCTAVSPDGKTVFVTGSVNDKYSVDYVTIAYNAATGATEWLRRYDGPSMMGDTPAALAVSPGGRTVFVTGTSTGKISGDDYLTIAYNAATGATRWVKRYNGQENGPDRATSLAVSPSGAAVFVTGSSTGQAGNGAYATVAYSAATGARLWARRYASPGKSSAQANSVAVSPSGGTVFVTGYSMGTTSNWDYATVAYNAATGAQLWVKRYNGAANEPDQALSAAVSPGGGTVVVTGTSTGSTGATPRDEIRTIAYAAATGATLWTTGYSTPDNGANTGVKAAVSPGGNAVLVTGYSSDPATNLDLITIAYDASTGATLWNNRYVAPGDQTSEGRSLAFSPDGASVYVTGMAEGSAGWDYLTVAYAAATGASLWVRRYDGPYHSNDYAASVAVSRVTGAVYVTGHSIGISPSDDYLTIAYSG